MTLASSLSALTGTTTSTVATRRALLRACVQLSFGAAAMGHAGALGALGRGPASDDVEAFLEAVRTGALDEALRLLSRAPTLAGARDDVGRSAFALAILHNHPEVAAAVRELGYAPDVVERCLAGELKAVIAEVGDDIEALAATPHPVGGNALWAAARGGVDDLWRLQSLGLDVERCANGGATGAVHAALQIEDPLTAWLTLLDLLGNSALPNAAAGSESPLALAMRRGDARLVATLLRKGATPTATSDALVSAASVQRDHRSSRFAYDASGAPWKRPDLDGVDVPTLQRIVGSSHRDLDTVKQLVGDDPRRSSAVSYQDELAVEAGAHMGNKAIVEFHLDNGAPLSLPTCFARGDLARAKALLAEDKLRAFERGAHDYAVMWYPVIGGCGVAGLELLMQHGAPVDQESCGTTALHWAAQRGDADAVAFLLEVGANPNAVGYRFGRRADTPLAVAERSEQPAIVKLLTACGGRR